MTTAAWWTKRWPNCATPAVSGSGATGGSRRTTMTQWGEQGSGPPADAAVRADTGAQRVAKVYAEALLNAAEKRGQADEVLEELESLVQDLFRADPEFETFLSSGAVGRDRKAAVLRTVFES